MIFTRNITAWQRLLFSIGGVDDCLSCSHNWNKIEIKQNETFYFSQKKSLKQSWNVLAVIAIHCRYPLFIAWRANSGYRLWLAITAKTVHELLSFLLVEIKCFISVLSLFYFDRADSFRPVKRRSDNSAVLQLSYNSTAKLSYNYLTMLVFPSVILNC